MIRRCISIAITALFVLLAGCTGESVRVVLPDRHPANPSAAEAPFVPFPDPFTPLPFPSVPSRPAEPHEHRHEHHPGQTDEDMRMDDMRMDDEKGGEMNHGSHGEGGAAEEGEKR